MSRNPEYCPHNMLDVEDGEVYCTECGVDMPGYCGICHQEMTANCNNAGCEDNKYEELINELDEIEEKARKLKG